MKQNIVFLALAMQAFTALSQPSSTSAPGVPTKVTDWGRLSLLVVETFFDNEKDSIVAQIGEAEFEKMKTLCFAAAWPKEIQGKMWKKSDSLQVKEHNKKLAALHVFRIASFQHIWQGQKMSRFVILRVPYSKNKDWNKEVKWDTIYFILRESAVTDLK